ncbi:CPBP family intramembrane metalloprotease [bacterium]|nr:CPBP family intramembrane metalloprotease [bacterium]
MPEEPLDPVEVYRASGLADAHVLRLRLDAEGISAWVDNELLQGAAGDLPLGWAAAPRVMVARADEAAARAVADQFTRDRPQDPPGGLACLACLSPMGAADTCPVCGWSYRDSPGVGAAEPSRPDPVDPVADPLHPVPGPTGRVRPGDWAEVAAVLAVGVVPYQVSTVTTFYAPSAPLPFWLDALQLVVLGGCTIFVTLYLVRRGGDGWAAIGVTRPGVVDVAGGLVLLFAAFVVWRLTAGLPDVGRPKATPLPRPDGELDYVLLVVKYGVSAFSEELVCRAYLVTRLAVLLRSRAAAVVYAAAVFASYHAYQGVQGVGSAFALGVVYGAAFLLIHRVWPLAIGHALYNLLADLAG